MKAILGRRILQPRKARNCTERAQGEDFEREELLTTKSTKNTKNGKRNKRGKETQDGKEAKTGRKQY